MFNHHGIHIPSLTTYLLLDLASYSLDQNMDWALGEKVGDPVQLQKEGKERWLALCRSAPNLIGEIESEEKGETLLGISTPFSVLLQCVVNLEKVYLPHAYMNQNHRSAWQTARLAAADCHDVASLIEQLGTSWYSLFMYLCASSLAERNISWSAVDNQWREERTPWRTDVMKVMNRKTMERLPQPGPQAWYWNNTTNATLTPQGKHR